MAKALQSLLTAFTIGTFLLPIDVNAQLYQDASNSTAVIVRDPARQASTEIDAAIYNPAGTAFLQEGWHLSLNGRLSSQNLLIKSEDNSVSNKTRDIIPSLQAAYKKGKLTASLSLGNEGGYGDWFAEENPLLSNTLNYANNQIFTVFKQIMSSNISSCNTSDELLSKAFVSGRLYNYTARLGAAYQITPHWSFYAGIRCNYYSESTALQIWRDVKTANSTILTPEEYFGQIRRELSSTNSAIVTEAKRVAELVTLSGIDASDLNSLIEGREQSAQVLDNIIKKYADTPEKSTLFDKKTSGWGIAPIIGIDYHIGNLNFGAKYEFATKIRTGDKSTNFDIPMLLTLGSSWQITENLKVSLGGSWMNQKRKNALGNSQSTDLSNEANYFNMTNSSVRTQEISFSTIDHGSLDAFGLSASINFSPIKRLILSAGYTYGEECFTYKSVYPQSVPSVYAPTTDVISAGLRYDISENIKVDFGISKKMQYASSSMPNIELSNHDVISFAGGINFSF